MASPLSRFSCPCPDLSRPNCHMLSPSLYPRLFAFSAQAAPSFPFLPVSPLSCFELSWFCSAHVPPPSEVPSTVPRLLFVRFPQLPPAGPPLARSMILLQENFQFKSPLFFFLTESASLSFYGLEFLNPLPVEIVCLCDNGSSFHSRTVTVPQFSPQVPSAVSFNLSFAVFWSCFLPPTPPPFPQTTSYFQKFTAGHLVPLRSFLFGNYVAQNFLLLTQKFSAPSFLYRCLFLLQVFSPWTILTVSPQSNLPSTLSAQCVRAINKV